MTLLFQTLAPFGYVIDHTQVSTMAVLNQGGNDKTK